MNIRLLPVAALLLGAPAASAQPDTVARWYVQAQASIGIAHQAVQHPPSSFHAQSPGLHEGLGILVGRQAGRWQGETGLLYWQNQTSRDVVVVNFASQFDPTGQQPATQIGLQERYRHLVVPLRVGYNLTPRSSTAFRVTGGILLSANTAHAVRFDTDTTAADDGFKASGLLGHGLARYSAWGTLGWQAQWRVSQRGAVVLGADAAYMLTPFARGTQQSQRSFVLAFNIGFRGVL